MAKKKPTTWQENILAHVPNITISKKHALYSVLGLCLLVFGLNAPFLGTRFGLFLNPPETRPINTVIPRKPNTLLIEALNIDAPLIYVTEKKEAVFQEALQHGVVHYPGTAAIGQVGNAYFFGHSSDLPWAKGEYKTIFAALPDITKGTNILVTDETGAQYNYTVTETKVIRPTDFSVLNQETNGKKILTLQTSYPLGTALRRFIVVAEIIPAP
jgi:LPXTG-site transpeptidase (sortase) family protein